MQRFTEKKIRFINEVVIEEETVSEELFLPLVERPLVAIGDTADISAFLRFAAPAATKAARAAGISRDNIEAFSAQYRAELEELIRGMDVRKFRMLEDLFIRGGDIRSHVDTAYLSGDSGLFLGIDIVTREGNPHDLKSLIAGLAELPADALLTPELGRYYFEELHGHPDKRLREQITAGNAESLTGFLRDMELNDGKATADFRAMHARHNEENKRISALMASEERLAKALFQAEENTRNAIGRSAFTKWRLARIERSIAKDFRKAQAATAKYVDSVKKQTEKQHESGLINDYAYEQRLEQLNTRDFSYNVMQSRAQSAFIGQKSYIDALDGFDEEYYHELDKKGREDMLKAFSRDERDDFEHSVKDVIESERSTHSMSEKALRGYIEKASREYAQIEMRSRAIRENMQRSTVSDAGRWTADAQKRFPNPAIALAYSEAYDAELEEAVRFNALAAEISEHRVTVFGYNIAKALGRENELYSPSEIAQFEEEARKLELAEKSLEDYKKALTRVYTSYKESGLRSPEFVDEKLRSIEENGLGGYVSARIDPIGDASRVEAALEAEESREREERESFTKEIMQKTRKERAVEEPEEDSLDEDDLELSSEDPEAEDEMVW